MSKIFAADEITLSNGIPVVLQHYDGPVAAMYWWVKTGSGDETAREAGFAHFLEHMLFKDTAAKETGKASTGQTARAIESLGGDINAYTSFDQTVYHVTCAAHHWERVIDAFGPMAKPQKFLKRDFVSEREVILEELRKNEDSPDRMMFQKMFSLTYSKHPYGRPVIGFVKTLKAAKVQELEAFYRRRYSSGNMGIVLVGPIDEGTGKRKKALLQRLEKYFGSKVMKKAPAVVVKRPPVAPFGREAGFSVQAFDIKSPKISFSFRVPNLMHEDVPALDLLSSILGMGELSRLYQRLFYKTSIATEASGGLYIPKDEGMLFFQAEVDSIEKINPAAEEMLKELKRIVDEGPTDDELKRVLVNAESEKLYATQTADGMASRLGFLRFVVGDLGHDQEYLEELHLVDSAKIREVARTYLDPKRMSGVVMVPKEHKSFSLDFIRKTSVEQLGALRDSVASAAPAQRSKKGSKTDTLIPLEFIDLPSGIRVVYHERPRSQAFSIHSAALGGLRLELADPVTSAESDWGSSFMTSLTWHKGTRTKSGNDIARITEGSAASIDGYAGRNTVGLQVTGLARDWGKLSDLFGEVLFDANFPTSEVDHSRRVAEDSVRSIEDHSAQLCTKLFLETLFEKHPYGRLTTGSLTSLEKIDSSKLMEFHKRWIQPKRLVLSISGAVKRAALDTWLSEIENRARAIQHVNGAHAVSLADESELKAPRWIEKSLGREQAHILVGGLGTRITAQDRHSLRLLHTILGGQSGRLFIELREKKSLAYTVSPLSMEGMERGYVGTYIACTPSKTQEAIEGIKTVLETLAKKGPTPAEMDRAKEFYLGRRAMDMQGDTTLAAHYGIETVYGIPHLTEEEIVRKIRSITAKDVREACRKYHVDPFMVTSTVG
jgi:zinc protease